MSSESNLNVPDDDLIIGCIKKDRRMQQLLYHRYASKMYAVCLRYGRNVEEADDLLQDGFLKVFRNLETYRRTGSFEGWMRKVFINTSIEHYRRTLRKLPVSDTPDINEAIEDASWNALDELTEKEIVTMIQGLSPGYRQVFNMFAIEGYSHKEISEALDISEGTSKSQLARAKNILKKQVDEKLLRNNKGFK